MQKKEEQKQEITRKPTTKVCFNYNIYSKIKYVKLFGGKIVRKIDRHKISKEFTTKYKIYICS